MVLAFTTLKGSVGATFSGLHATGTWRVALIGPTAGTQPPGAARTFANLRVSQPITRS